MSRNKRLAIFDDIDNDLNMHIFPKPTATHYIIQILSRCFDNEASAILGQSVSCYHGEL